MYRREMVTVCKGCGTREADWRDDPDAFIGDFRQCPGCVRLEEEQENAKDMKGVHYRLLPKEQALAKAEEMGNVKEESDVLHT